MSVGQIFHCVLPHSGLLWSCQCLPFIKNGGSSWDRMLPHYLRLWFKLHILRKLAPVLFLFWLLPALSVTANCSCVLCLLRGVSSPATHFPYVHLMRWAPLLGWGKREVFICTTNFHPRFYKIFKSFLSWTWNLLPLIVEMFPLNVYSFSFLGNKLSHCSVSARVTTGPSAFYANQEGSRVSLTLSRSAEDLAFGNEKGECHLFRRYMLVASLITRFLWQLSRLNLWAFDL